MAAGDLLDDDASLVVERRNESLRWWNDTYYGEFTEVFRASKCRTDPIMVRDSGGRMVEDKTRTNVAMPDIAVMIRRGTARMTRNAPRINYIASDDNIAKALTAWAYWQFDKTKEKEVHVLHIQQCKTFGYSVTKSYWERFSRNRKFRRQRTKVTDRSQVMEAMGATPEQIQQAVAQQGKQLSQQEITSMIAQYGPEILMDQETKKFEGPRTAFVFIGDFFPEPGFRSLDGDCQYIVEQYYQTAIWLKARMDWTYTDLDTGKEIPVFDSKVCQEMLDDESGNTLTKEATDSLRVQMWGILGKSDPALRRNAKLVRGKRFYILESHDFREDGRWWISWVGNEKYALGEMPYPFDLEGSTAYTDMITMPDLVDRVGDSTARLGRFIYKLHNASVNQRTDLVSNILQRTVLMRQGANLPEPISRTGFRVYTVKEMTDFKILEEPDVPASAWQSEQQCLQQLGMLDPSLTTTEAGTAAVPMAGKTATTASIQQRNNDVLLEADLEGYNTWLRAVEEKKLCMLQGNLQATLSIPDKYARQAGIAQENGRPAAVELSPYDIQEEIEVQPEVGSTLAADDEFRRMNAQNMYQMAAGNPAVWNVNKAATEYVKTLRGIDTTGLINPPQPPQPPEPKTSISINIKWEELTPDEQAQIMQRQGVQVNMQELQSKEALKAVVQTGKAAEAAGKLAEPAVEPMKGQMNGMDGTQQRPAVGPKKAV